MMQGWENKAQEELTQNQPDWKEENIKKQMSYSLHLLTNIWNSNWPW